MNRPRFHLAFPVTDIESTRRFYVDAIGCTAGREADHWIDLDFHGHQLSAHVADAIETAASNAVDGKAVPVRHFGLILAWADWEALAERLRGIGVAFRIAPYVRFEGEAGEQGTFFVEDPSGNALEFKSFRNESDIFRRG